MILRLYVPLERMNCDYTCVVIVRFVRRDGRERWVTVPREGGDVTGLEG